MKITDRQMAVLKRLASRDLDLERDGAETGRQIAFGCGVGFGGIFTSAEQGQQVCKQLEQKGLAEKLGVGMDNARTWTATEAGRALLRERTEA